ncbi:MAG TPA: hypothetical protein PLX15_03175 [Candidatus Woesearchaeota archaeon]|nr:hypothetical protein [Candidatus Woesearchaeota archaeon]
MISIKSKKGENNLMLSETAMLIIVATILIIMLVILVRMYLIFEDPDVIASKQAYNRLFKAIESVRSDDGITYEIVSLRDEFGIIILNPQSDKNGLVKFKSTDKNELFDVTLSKELLSKKKTQICFFRYEKTKWPRQKTISQVNECKELNVRFSANYLFDGIYTEYQVVELRNNHDGTITISPTNYDTNYVPESVDAMKAFFVDEMQKQIDKVTTSRLIDLKIDKWYQKSGKVAIEKEGLYVIKLLDGPDANPNPPYNSEFNIKTKMDIGIVVIMLKNCNPTNNLEFPLDSESEEKINICSVKNIMQLKGDRTVIVKEANNLEYKIKIENLKEYNAVNSNTGKSFEFKDYIGSNTEPRKSYQYYKIKNVYLYILDKEIRLGIFVFSEIDLDETYWENIISNVNFQNKVKELVCGEGNVDDCNIF